MSTKDLKEKGTHFLLLTGSTLLMAVGTYFFKFTNNFTFGGITGLAVLIAKTGDDKGKIRIRFQFSK